MANEPLRPRAAVLAENMQKWGHPDVVVTSAWPAAFQALPAYFDVIAADVPCSGEGMFRKDAGAVGEWSLQNVAQCAARQRDIIRDVWPALRPGGFLVYSTCTFNRQEDEENVRFICQELGAEPVRIDVPEEWGIEGDTAGTDLPVYHFFPHRARGEGFFLALLRKTADEPLHQFRKIRSDKQLSVPRNAPFRQWLREPEAWTFMYTDEGRVSAVHSWWKDDACRLRQNIRTLLCGVEVAEEKGARLFRLMPWLCRARRPEMFLRRPNWIMPPLWLICAMRVWYWRAACPVAMCAWPMRAVPWALLTSWERGPTTSILPSGAYAAVMCPLRLRRQSRLMMMLIMLETEYSRQVTLQGCRPFITAI